MAGPATKRVFLHRSHSPACAQGTGPAEPYETEKETAMRDIEIISKELGLKVLPPDHRIYSLGATIRFVNRPAKAPVPPAVEPGPVDPENPKEK